MKNLLKTIITLVFVISFWGCSSDSSDEPCTPITCLNNGVSNSTCGCDCPQGFSGNNCGTALQPSKVIITKVVVKSFPNLNPQGLLWDGTNDADIYIKINNGTTYIYDHPTYISNASGGTNLNYQFILNPNLQITNVNTVMFVELWDYDLADIPSNADDFMVSAPFLPFNGNSFPSVLTVNSLTSPSSFELHLSYQW